MHHDFAPGRGPATISILGHRGFFLIPVLALLLSWPAPPARAAIVFSDGELADDDWSLTALVCGTSSSTSFHDSTEGNPPASRRVSNEVNVPSGSYSNAATAAVYLASLVDPAATGGIAHVSWSADFSCHAQDGCFGSGAAAGLLLSQDGRLYFGPAAAIGVGTAWTARSGDSLVATNFRRVDTQECPGNIIAVDTFPDFSPGGAPIRLGWFLWNSGNISYTAVPRIDNWTATIETGVATSVAEVVTDGETSLPARLHGLEARPNPFNPTTVIRYRAERAASVTIAIYDTAGRRVRTLHRGFVSEGDVEIAWQGRDEQGNAVPSGRYFVNARANGVNETTPVVLVR